jgi:hypothetical protein
VPWGINRRVRPGRLVVPTAQGTIIVPPLTPAASRTVAATNSLISVLRILGVVLLIVGLAGTVLTTLYVVRGSRRRPAATG